MKEIEFLSEISAKDDGKKIAMHGWVKDIRDLGGLKFLLVRDRTSEVQVTCIKGKTSEKIFSKVSNIPRESAVRITGVVKKTNKTRSGVEIIPIDIDILAKSESPLPLDMVKESSVDKRFDNRFLDLRRRKNTLIFIIKSKMFKYAREFLDKKGFIEIQTPKIVSVGAEGGATLFPLVYFDKEAYLAQSPQFYKQMMQSAGFSKVYEISPAFRAELSHTTRHVSEFISLDVEMSFIDGIDALMDLHEDLIIYMFKKLKENHGKELTELGIDIKIPKKPFPRMSLKEVEKFTKKHASISVGAELGTEEEKLLGELVKKKYNHDFVFVTEFPWSARPFYHMKDGNITRSFDLLYKGLEISTGAQREHRIDILKKQAAERNISEESLKYYLQCFKYGMPPHGGFGTGLERILEKLLNLRSVKEAILFPRDPDRLVP